MAELADIRSTAEEFLALAAHHLSIGDVGQAERTARAVLKMTPRSSEGWHLLGDVLSLSPGRRGEASEAYNRAVELDPSDNSAATAVTDLGKRDTIAPTRDANASTSPHRDMQLPHLAPNDGKERQITEARAAEARGDWSAAKQSWEAVLDIDPSDTWAWSQYGHLLSVNLQQYDDAEAAFRRAIEEDPTDDWAWGKLGIMLADFMGRVSEGQQMLRKAISLDPTECYYRGWLGWSLYRQSEDLAAAECELEEAVRLWPDYQWAFFHLGFVRMELGNKAKDAEKALRRALMLEPDDIPTLYALAGLYEEQLKRPRKAMRIYEKLADLVPNDPIVYRSMGMLYQSTLGEPEKAVEAYLAALKIDAHDFDVLTRLGWVTWEVLGKTDAGLKHLHEAAVLAPESAWVATHLGQAYFHGKQDFASAEKWYQKALELDAGYDWAHAMLGTLLAEHLDAPERGIEHLREAVRLSPDYAYAWAKLGRVTLLQDDDHEAAWQALAKAIELSPKSVDALSDIVWMGIYRLFRADLIADYARRLVSLDSESCFARIMLAYVLRLTGAAPEYALEECRKAIELGPEDHFAWHALGEVLLYDYGDIESAEEVLLKAQALEHSCASTFSDIGLIRLAGGRGEEAALYFEKALETDDECAAAWRAYGCFLFYSGGDEATAEGAMERAIELEVDNFEGWALLAALLERQDDREEEAAEVKIKADQLAPEGLDAMQWAEKFIEPLALLR